MATWNFLRPKRESWFRAFVIALVVSMVAYVAWGWWKPWGPGRAGGLTFGTLAAVLFFIDAFYPLRRRLLGWPFGTAQRWLQFHIYGGVLALVYALIHVGFRLPNGLFGWFLFLLSAWATVSGLIGVYLQKYVPTLMAANLAVEAIFERIPDMTGRLQGEADRLLVGAPDVLQRFYSSNMRPWLGTLTPSWGYVVDFRSERERRLAPFNEVAPFLSETDRGRLTDLQAIATEKLELDVQYSLQRVLRAWVPLHALPSLVLMGLLVVHVVAVLLF